MANNLTSNPLILDTAAAGDVLAASAPIKVAKFRWVRGTGGVAGDNISVTDSAGNEKWACFDTVTAATTYEEDSESDFYPVLEMKGLKLPTMSRGKLYVYLAPAG